MDQSETTSKKYSQQPKESVRPKVRPQQQDKSTQTCQVHKPSNPASTSAIIDLSSPPQASSTQTNPVITKRLQIVQSFSQMVKPGKGPRMYCDLQGLGSEVGAMDFRPRSTLLVLGSLGKDVWTWDFSTHDTVLRLLGHTGPVNDVCFSPQRQVVASGSSDKTARIWMLCPRGMYVELKGHIGPVRSVHFSPDDCQIATASDDTTVKIWPKGSSAFTFNIKAHSDPVKCVRFSPHDSLLASCGTKVVLSDVRHHKATHEYQATATPLCFDFHPSRPCLGVGMNDGSIQIYDVRTHQPLQSHTPQQGPVHCLHFHNSGNIAAAAAGGGGLLLLDLVTSGNNYTLQVNKHKVTCCCFTSDGAYVASASPGNQVIVWKLNLELGESNHLPFLVDDSHRWRAKVVGGGRACEAPITREVEHVDDAVRRKAHDNPAVYPPYMSIREFYTKHRPQCHTSLGPDTDYSTTTSDSPPDSQ